MRNKEAIRKGAIKEQYGRSNKRSMKEQLGISKGAIREQYRKEK